MSPQYAWLVPLLTIFLTGCASNAPDATEDVRVARRALSATAATDFSSDVDAPIDVVSWAPGRLDVFARGIDDNLWIKSWTGQSWVPSQFDYALLGGPIVGTVSVASWGPNRLDLFARGTDGNCYIKSWTGSAWFPSLLGWNGLGMPSSAGMGARPKVISTEVNHLDIIAPDGARMLYIKSWDGQNWIPSQTGWSALGGPFVGAPEAVSWDSSRLDVLARGEDGNLWLKSRVDATWIPSQTTWAAMGAPAGANIAAKPSVASWQPGRLDIFVSATDGNVYIKSWTGSAWVPSQLGWNSMGAPAGKVLGAPQVVSWGPNRLDVFARGVDGQLYIKSWVGDSWVPSQLGWNSLAAPPGGFVPKQPRIVSWSANRLDIFASGTDDNVYIKSWTGSSWVPSQLGWASLAESTSAPVDGSLPLKGRVATDAVEMLPFWTTTTMYDESVMMVSTNGGTPQARLLWPADEILSVRSSNLGTQFTPNVDWSYDAGSNILSLPSTSHAPSISASAVNDLHEDHDNYHANQLAVTYRHAPSLWNGPAPAASSKLSNTRAKLAGRSAVRMVFYGDSITAGFSASGFSDPSRNYSAAAPYMKPWTQLVTERLAAAFGSDPIGSNIETWNPSVAGQDSAWGAQNSHVLVASHAPDLVVIAFGMNDGSARVAASTFKANIQAIIADVRSANPRAEFVLVSPMLPNPAGFAAGDQAQYAAVLQQITDGDAHIDFANMTQVHQTLLSSKSYVDMTGNGVNHPNDFLARWYGQLVARLLGAI